MSITSNNDNTTSTTATTVTIRIPHGSDSDLLSAAEERLARAEDIDSVTIHDLHGIQPKLSATVITVGATLRWTTTTTDARVRERLAEVPGFESVEQNNESS